MILEGRMSSVIKRREEWNAQKDNDSMGEGQWLEQCCMYAVFFFEVKKEPNIITNLKPCFWWPGFAVVPPQSRQVVHSLLKHGPSLIATLLKPPAPQRAPCGRKPNDFSVGHQQTWFERWQSKITAGERYHVLGIQIQAGASEAGDFCYFFPYHHPVVLQALRTVFPQRHPEFVQLPLR